MEEKNPPCFISWGQASLKNQTDTHFWDRTHWSLNSPFLMHKAWLDWLRGLEGAGRISESTPLCAACRVPSVMGSFSGYSLLVLWQITVIELSWSLTNFHWMVFHEGEPSSITVNVPNLITANQKCEEKHFLWVSGAQQVGQPTGVWISVCLSGWGEWWTLQILQHVKAAESPTKC